MAKNDLSLARDLSGSKGRYHYAAHFCHQSLEKMLKAVISERTTQAPFPTHNFKILLDQSGIKDVSVEMRELLIGMIPHYIGTKYPEDIAKLYKQYTKSYVAGLLKKQSKGLNG
ncbi:MAG: HEPN domain-containing protein [Candidatus Omnitrophica bacterium]|nr:HEPN domain-containing protein [Candidatus Omnitrophota bacterium]